MLIYIRKSCSLVTQAQDPTTPEIRVLTLWLQMMINIIKPVMMG
jgi:hypothetical protein